MANWFNSKKEKSPVYTMRDKERELMEFKMQLELAPLAELWRKICDQHKEKCFAFIANYEDFLCIMKSFYGENNPLINKFEVIIQRFKNDCYEYYSAVRDSIDEAIDKKRIELKSKD